MNWTFNTFPVFITGFNFASVTLFRVNELLRKSIDCSNNKERSELIPLLHTIESAMSHSFNYEINKQS